MRQGDFPDGGAFVRAMVATGQYEIIKQDLYDTALYPTAGQVLLPFFNTQKGAGLSAQPGNANQVKSIADTNMVLGGQLQRGQAFFIDNIQVDFQPGSVSTANTFTPNPPGVATATAIVTGAATAGINDVSNVLNSGALSLLIGTKPYLDDAPLAKFPPQYRVEVNGMINSDSDGAAMVVIGRAYSGGMRYQVNPGITITDGMNFGINLTWPVVVATPSGFNGQMRCILGGWLARPVQ